MVVQYSEYSKKALLNGKFYIMLNYTAIKKNEKKSIKLSDLTVILVKLFSSEHCPKVEIKISLRNVSYKVVNPISSNEFWHTRPHTPR